jgi:uncharacterized protein
MPRRPRSVASSPHDRLGHTAAAPLLTDALSPRTSRRRLAGPAGDASFRRRSERVAGPSAHERSSSKGGTRGSTIEALALGPAVEHRNAEALLSTYAENVVITEASSLPYGGVYHGHEGALRHGMAYLAAWDSIQTADDRKLQPLILNAGDRVIVVWRQKATAADGRRLDLPVIDLIELRDAQVESLQMYHLDTAAVLEFLGTTTAAAA